MNKLNNEAVEASSCKDLLDAAVEEILERLFTNGGKQKARRLVLELEDGRDGGGLCRAVVRDLLRDVLQKRSV